MKSGGWVISGWLAAIAAGIWFTEARYLIPQGKPMEARTPLASTSADRPRIVFFWSPGCPCSRDAEQDIREVVEKHRDKIDFEIAVIHHGSAAEGTRLWSKVGIHVPETSAEPFALAKSYDVPSSPGAVVFDRDGKLIYRGGFNIARFCHTAETAFVRLAADAVVAGKTPKHREGPFFGCGIGSRN